MTEISNIVSQISTFRNKNKLTVLEEKRLADDLGSILHRLKAREYKIGNVSVNTFNIPDRTKEFFCFMDYYHQVGKAWEKILKNIRVKKFKQVCDLCPGYMPKVLLGLFYCDYKGKVVLVDQDINSMKELKTFMALFNPKFTIQLTKTNLFKLRNCFIFPVILANHIIDDLAMDYFARKRGIAMQSIYDNEKTFLEHWNYITIKADSNIAELMPKIVSFLNKLTKKGSLIILTHYRSYIERIFNLKNVTTFNKKLLANVTSTLCQNDFIKLPNRVERALNKFKSDAIYILKRIH